MAIRRAKVGEVVQVHSIDHGGSYTSRRKRFFVENKKGLARVAVPLGSRLYFYNGIPVRFYDATGAGNVGHPAKQFWSVTVVRRNRKRGLLLPEGNEIVGNGHTIHREPNFVPLVSLLDCAAKVIALPG